MTVVGTMTGAGWLDRVVNRRHPRRRGWFNITAEAAAEHRIGAGRRVRLVRDAVGAAADGVPLGDDPLALLAAHFAVLDAHVVLQLGRAVQRRRRPRRRHQRRFRIAVAILAALRYYPRFNWFNQFNSVKLFIRQIIHFHSDRHPDSLTLSIHYYH